MIRENGMKNVRDRFILALRQKTFQKRFLWALALLTLVVIAFILNRRGGVAPERVLGILQAYPVMAPALFLLLFVFMTVVLVPTLPLNLLAGFLWGPYWGSLASVVAATSGALCAFLISRYLAGDYCRRRFKNPAWLWLQDEIDRRGWKAVAFVRINPIFSSGPLNYYFGITPVPLSTFAWATALFFIPPSAVIASIGHFIGRSTLTGGAQNLLQNIVVMSAVITILLIVTVILRRWLQNKS